MKFDERVVFRFLIRGGSLCNISDVFDYHLSSIAKWHLWLWSFLTSHRKWSCRRLWSKIWSSGTLERSASRWLR